MNIGYEIGLLAARVALDPDQDKGRWSVMIDGPGKEYVKECPNLVTARAWAGYLQRQGWTSISLRKL